MTVEASFFVLVFVLSFLILKMMGLFYFLACIAIAVALPLIGTLITLGKDDLEKGCWFFIRSFFVFWIKHSGRMLIAALLAYGLFRLI